MLFNSFTFLFIFFPLLFILYTAQKITNTNSQSIQILFLFASCIFVLSSGVESLIILSVSLFLNFSLIYLMCSCITTNHKKITLIFSICFNLSYLSAFKYDEFLSEISFDITGIRIPTFTVELPLAISFYTFQIIALTIDIWHKKVSRPPLIKFLLFVSFFPQLIAGPIVRYIEIEKRLNFDNSISFKNILTGSLVFYIGLFKKSVIADSLSPNADIFFAQVQSGISPTLFEAWGGTFLYTFQIYFDFSGYSDMAIGLALIFNIKLPFNFDSPYKAISVIDFWRRWHISLSRFLQDYLYVPLGGNRHGTILRWRNIFITMLLGGLWHGAAWNFVFWGGLNGLLIAINHTSRHLRFSVDSRLSWFLTFFSISSTWILFRSPDTESALRIYSGIMGLNGIALPESFAAYLTNFSVPFVRFSSSELIKTSSFALIFISAIITFFLPNTNQIISNPDFFIKYKYLKYYVIGFISSLGIMSINQGVEFVYFRF